MNDIHALPSGKYNFLTLLYSPTDILYLVRVYSLIRIPLATLKTNPISIKRNITEEPP